MTQQQWTALGLRHAAIPVVDLKRALKFYTEVLAFSAYHVSDSDWAMLQLRNTTLSLVPGPSSLIPLSQHDGVPGRHPAHLGIVVDSEQDVHLAHASLVRFGAKTGAVSSHRDGSVGFYFLDSEGNQLELIYIPIVPRVSSTSSAVTSAQTRGGVLLVHGSHDVRWQETVQKILARIQKHSSGTQLWKLANMEFISPTLQETVELMMAEKPELRVVRILPLFWSSGGHVAKDVRPMVLDLQRRYPNLSFEFAEALGENVLIQDVVAAIALSPEFKTFV